MTARNPDRYGALLMLLGQHQNQSLRASIAFDAAVTYWTTDPMPAEPVRTSIGLINDLIGAQDGPKMHRVSRATLVRIVNDSRDFLRMHPDGKVVGLWG